MLSWLCSRELHSRGCSNMESGFVGYLLLVSSVQKTSHSHVFLVRGQKCRLLGTNNECTASEIKGLERGEEAITSFHGHLFPSHDGGNSKLALLQDLGGKICRPTTTANSTLGECSCGVSVIKAICTQEVSTKDTVPACCVKRGQGPAVCLPVPHRGGGGKLLSAAWGPAGLEQL